MTNPHGITTGVPHGMMKTQSSTTSQLRAHVSNIHTFCQKVLPLVHIGIGFKMGISIVFTYFPLSTFRLNAIRRAQPLPNDPHVLRSVINLSLAALILRTILSAGSVIAAALLQAFHIDAYRQVNRFGTNAPASRTLTWMQSR